MNFIIKLFPEIIIKSRSVRLHFIKILCQNIKKILKKKITINFSIIRHWDNIEIIFKQNDNLNEINNTLNKIPGIHTILLIEKHKFNSLNQIAKISYLHYSQILKNNTFCVRIKRTGNHKFTSIEAESYIGSFLNHKITSSIVKLKKPDITINLEIKQNIFILIKNITKGIGGFPIGTQGDVLSLISGGFDSSVSSYMLMRRGCRVHYCFFEMGGGIKHQSNIKRIVTHLWNKFGSSHKIRFIIINFLKIITEISSKIHQNYMGIILKRMMIRAASKIAKIYKIQALATGESLGQVSSQTLTNLTLINSVTNTLILRPLISYDKEKIIKLTRMIGTEQYSQNIQEFCGMGIKKSAAKTTQIKIDNQEINFNFKNLEYSIKKAKNFFIKNNNKNVNFSLNKKNKKEIETIEIPSKNDIILDIRSLEEQKNNPLLVKNVQIKSFPFYKLEKNFCQLSPKKTYLLYCETGIMSKLQIIHLNEKGFKNIKIYNPKK